MGGGGWDFKRFNFFFVHVKWKSFFFLPNSWNVFFFQQVKLSYVSYVTFILNNNKNLIRQLIRKID